MEASKSIKRLEQEAVSAKETASVLKESNAQLQEDINQLSLLQNAFCEYFGIRCTLPVLSYDW